MTVLARPFYHWTTYEGHGGIDYPQARGTGVPASGPGVIDFSGYYSARGGWAKFIQYDCGCRHGYYHFDREQGLSVGDRVDYGTIFAFVGGTGLYSTGPHLHHEVWDGHSLIIKPPAYWQFVNINSWVGDGTFSGTDVTTFPLDTPPPAPAPVYHLEDTMARPIAYAKGDKSPEVYAVYLDAGANNPQAPTQGGVYCARRYCTAGEYAIAVANGYKLQTIPQADLDALPKVYGSK